MGHFFTMKIIPTPDNFKENRCLERKIKILFLTLNSNLQGPLPKLASLLIAGLELSGCQVTRSSWGRHSDSENIFRKIFGRLEDIIKAVFILNTKKPDILYIATTLDESALLRDIPLLLATYWSRAKKIVKIHGSKADLLINPKHKIYKFLTYLLIRLSDSILMLSNEELNAWTRFYPKGKYYRVDNPISPNNISSLSSKFDFKLPDTYPTLLFVGRLIKEKGIHELIAAMKDILKQIECRLLIAGVGEEKEEIVQKIKNGKMEKYISLLGYLNSEELNRAYQESSIFILPSYREGFPNSILESMGYGLPIIVTPVGAITDHLQDGVNAIFIKPKDPNAITNAVIHLLNDPKLYFEMGQANFDKIKEFSLENIIHEYLKIFHELLELC
jgi:glycosyltransferase involved in cell wall biosynthesis